MAQVDAEPIGYTGEKHPEVFDRIEHNGPTKPGQLSKEQINEYYEKGYTIVRDFFTDEEIESVRKEVNSLVDKMATKMFEAGKIKSTYSEMGFNDRLTAMEKDFPGANIVTLKACPFSQALCSIAANDRLLNLLEDFIGPDIAFNPVWNLRTKTPNNTNTVVPWHQDSGYFDHGAYTLQIMTAWIPLVDATFNNGTMEFVRDCHKDGYVARHTCCDGPTWYITLEEEEMIKSLGVDMDKDTEVLEVPVGSFILFNNFTPHRSLTNTSQGIRWALDFRWQKGGTSASLFGLKDPCLLRSSEQPDFKPDWETFNSVDRNKQQDTFLGKKDADEFSSEISGPWMKNWPIVNHNRHTDSFIDDSSKWDSNMVHG